MSSRRKSQTDPPGPLDMAGLQRALWGAGGGDEGSSRQHDQSGRHRPPPPNPVLDNEHTSLPVPLDMDNIREIAETLHTQGVVVVKTRYFERPDLLGVVQQGLIDVSQNSPGFIPEEEVSLCYLQRSPDPEPEKHLNKAVIRIDKLRGLRQGGGFQALGDPGSFYHHKVQEVRRVIMSDMSRGIAMIGARFGKHQVRPIIDRTMVRIPRTTLTGETFHRDLPRVQISTTKENKLLSHTELQYLGDSLALGGWINTDPQASQGFSCVLGTHLDVSMADVLTSEADGFSTFDEKTIKGRRYNDRKVLVNIPPGCVVMFDERIVHEVRSNTTDEYMTRVFFGWKFITNCSKPDRDLIQQELNSTIGEELRSMSPVTLKSGQIPPMYSKNWASCLKYTHLLPWVVRNIHPSMRIMEYTTEKRARDGSTKQIRGKTRDPRGHLTDRFWPGLRTMAEWGVPRAADRDTYPRPSDGDVIRYTSYHPLQGGGTQNPLLDSLRLPQPDTGGAYLGDCAICLDEMFQGTPGLVTLPLCRHVFHHSCFAQLASRAPMAKCPLDRTPVGQSFTASIIREWNAAGCPRRV